MPLFLSPIITIPATGTADLLAYVGQLITDTWQFTALAVGVPLAFYVIARAIGLVGTNTRART